jgi:hypothetical protein
MQKIDSMANIKQYATTYFSKNISYVLCFSILKELLTNSHFLIKAAVLIN